MFGRSSCASTAPAPRASSPAAASCNAAPQQRRDDMVRCHVLFRSKTGTGDGVRRRGVGAPTLGGSGAGSRGHVGHPAPRTIDARARVSSDMQSFATVHSSLVSSISAPTFRIMASSLGRMPLTCDRRFTTPLTRLSDPCSRSGSSIHRHGSVTGRRRGNCPSGRRARVASPAKRRRRLSPRFGRKRRARRGAREHGRSRRSSEKPPSEPWTGSGRPSAASSTPGRRPCAAPAPRPVERGAASVSSATCPPSCPCRSRASCRAASRRRPRSGGRR